MLNDIQPMGFMYFELAVDFISKNRQLCQHPFEGFALAKELYGDVSWSFASKSPQLPPPHRSHGFS